MIFINVIIHSLVNSVIFCVLKLIPFLLSYFAIASVFSKHRVHWFVRFLICWMSQKQAFDNLNFLNCTMPEYIQKLWYKLAHRLRDNCIHVAPQVVLIVDIWTFIMNTQEVYGACSVPMGDISHTKLHWRHHVNAHADIRCAMGLLI